MFIVSRKLYSEDVEYNRHLPGLLDKDNVGLAVVLASAGSGATLTLATTHLLFSPKRGEVRLAQTALLLAHLDAITWNSESPHHTTHMTFMTFFVYVRCHLFIFVNLGRVLIIYHPR